MKLDVVLGLQWGDEGKGKIVDALAPEYDIIARFQGGPNAGHTISFNNNKYILHIIPSGIFHENIINVIGNGTVIDPVLFSFEYEMLKKVGLFPENNLLISNKAHLITPTHKLLDYYQEKKRGDNKIGSTLKGIGPSYGDKYSRKGLRVESIFHSSFFEHYKTLRNHHLESLREIDINEVKLEGYSFQEYEEKWFLSIELLKKFNIVSTEIYLNKAIDEKKRILAEGAQGTLLDIDFGSYPYVTSSHTTIGGVISGLGVPPQRIGRVFGVFKAYCTRVGNGPFPTEINSEVGNMLRDLGHEYGSTTGRPRRVGWLDLPALRYAIMINGVTDLIMTKADVLADLDSIKICYAYQVNNKSYTHPVSGNFNHVIPLYRTFSSWDHDLVNIKQFDDLSPNLHEFIRYIESQIETSISAISLGPDREQLIKKNI
ncbi:MAG: adenylosuccinate synthase [Bacteroidales bacterium]|nr:adenylosuccinate synthase [Bacteroidales bacterium]